VSCVGFLQVANAQGLRALGLLIILNHRSSQDLAIEASQCRGGGVAADEATVWLAQHSRLNREYFAARSHGSNTGSRLLAWRKVLARFPFAAAMLSSARV
jgi:hypothetical protein